MGVLSRKYFFFIRERDENTNYLGLGSKNNKISQAAQSWLADGARRSLLRAWL